jgi:hypothetical protein
MVLKYIEFVSTNKIQVEISDFYCTEVVFWIMTNYSQVGAYHHFRETCFHQLKVGTLVLMKTVYTSETMVTTYKTLQCYNSEDHSLECAYSKGQFWNYAGKTFGFHKKLGNYWVASQLVASRVVISSIESVNYADKLWHSVSSPHAELLLKCSTLKVKKFLILCILKSPINSEFTCVINPAIGYWLFISWWWWQQSGFFIIVSVLPILLIIIW